MFLLIPKIDDNFNEVLSQKDYCVECDFCKIQHRLPLAANINEAQKEAKSFRWEIRMDKHWCMCPSCVKDNYN